MRSALLYGLLLLAALPSSLQAGQFQVSPVRIELSDENRSTLLKLSSQDTRPVRLQVTVYAWSQDGKQDLRLEPTQDILYYPKLLTLQPGSVQSVRLSTLRPQGAVEQAYRIVVEELPTAVAAGDKGEIRIRTKLNIPVFLKPVAARTEADIALDSMRQNIAVFAVRNTGNVNLHVSEFEMQGFAAGNASSKPNTLGRQRGWYLLPGATRKFAFRIPSELCLEATRVTLKTTHKAFKKLLPARQCSPLQVKL